MNNVHCYEIRCSVVYSHETTYHVVRTTNVTEAWRAYDELKMKHYHDVPAYGQLRPQAMFAVHADGKRVEITR